MEAPLSLTILLAAVLLLVKAQSEPNYKDIVTGLLQLEDGEGKRFQPLVDKLEIYTLQSEAVDVSAKQLTFPIQETVCSYAKGPRGNPCLLKKNGTLMMCSVEITYPANEPSNILISPTTCTMATDDGPQKQRIRTRRSKSNRGSKGNKGSRGGRGSRPGSGSSIAGGGNRGNSGTRTA